MAARRRRFVVIVVRRGLASLSWTVATRSFPRAENVLSLRYAWYIASVALKRVLELVRLTCGERAFRLGCATLSGESDVLVVAYGVLAETLND
jgi:hypothetical protein